MTHRLIKIEDYWVVVSDEIAGWSSTYKTYNSDGRIGMAENNQSKVILASQNPEHNLPTITFSITEPTTTEEYFCEIEWKCSMCNGNNSHKMSCKTPSLRKEIPSIYKGAVKVIKAWKE